MVIYSGGRVTAGDEELNSTQNPENFPYMTTCFSCFRIFVNGRLLSSNFREGVMSCEIWGRGCSMYTLDRL